MDVESALLRATGLLGTRRYPDAERAVADLLAQHPGVAAGWCVLAACRIEVGDLLGAERAAGRAVELAPADPLPYRLCSAVLTLLDRHDEAVECARFAAFLDPHDWQNHAQVAEAINALGPERPELCDEALAAAGRACALAPDSADAHAVLGLAALHAHDWERSRAAHRRALELDPRHPVALHNLAVLRRHNARASG